VILVENSDLDNKTNFENLDKIIEKFNAKNIKFTIINNYKKLSRGLARNIGIDSANGEVIIFIDDDTIIIGEDSFQKISNLAQKYDYGYGALRYWTNPIGWFEKNSQDILKKLENGQNAFKNHIGKIQLKIRNNENLDLQHYSFIANFGFCTKNLLKKTTGFPDFKDYGCEDDYFMFQLFKISGNYTILRDISVIHITHKINPNTNFSLYFEKLIAEGYFWFHVGKTFFDLKQLRKDEVLEKLSSYHPDYRIAVAYEQYQTSCPPNIKKKEVLLWKQRMQYHFIDFIQLLKKLLESSCLDEFIKNSNSDFDNIIPFIDVCIKNKLCKIDKRGRIKNTFNFKYFPDRKFDKQKSRIKLIFPSKKWNQFPCDIHSRERRVSLIKDRFPYTDFIRITLIGDDDLLTIPLSQYSWIETNTIDLDKRVLNTIRFHCPNAEIHNLDLSKKINGIKPSQTFITDPPYTLHGALLFIVRGLSLLEYNGEIKEFFVVLNSTMIGENMKILQEILLKNGVWLHETILNFNQYHLPEKYPERTRANNFLKNNNIDIDAVTYSSSSNLFIFRTISPNISALESLVEKNQIYNHLL